MAEGSTTPPPAYRSPKNYCGACGHDFSHLSLFDEHRKDYRINRNQELVGRCRDPQETLVEFNGVWYTPEGRAKAEAGAERLKRYRGSTDDPRGSG